MARKYIMYNDERQQQLTELLSLQNPTIPVLTANKKKMQYLATFLKDVKLVTEIINGSLVINSIEMSKIKIKIIPNAISKEIIQHFNTKSAYVATTEKKILNKIENFYCQLYCGSENKVIFNTSLESNLQRALYIDCSANDEKKQLLANGQSDIRKLIKLERQETGYASVFILGTIVAVLLTFMSILVVTKILNL